MILNPTRETFADLDPRSREILQKTVAFFEAKGKARLKEDDRERTWYADFLEFVREERVFATFLTPAAYADGDPDTRWDTHRICAMNEVLAFYGLPYWYTWQVTILGLGPIWMGDNEAVKHRTARLLRDGAIFAFGLSEQAHGADLYSSEMALTPLPGGGYRASGRKYYIGNGNEAALVSTFGKRTDTGEYVFFAVESGHPAYECVQNVVNSQSYVAEYALHDYPVADADLLSSGEAAWNSALNTVNVGKFNLGWASIGICAHAFHEALNHAAGRNLYGRFVTEFPHVRELFTEAYARLAAMKLFSRRAADYFRAASREDRRYLLYNPLVKMKVTMEGERVIDRLWDVIAARGFEKDTYFEMAARDIRALPKLEGTVHVNMALVVKFMTSYLFRPAELPAVPRRDDPADDPFLFDQGPARGLAKIPFHPWEPAFSASALPNVGVLREQIAGLRDLLAAAPPTPEQQRDIGTVLLLGELFSVAAYGHLILEQAAADAVPDALLDEIFAVLVRDVSSYAVDLHARPGLSAAQSAGALALVRKPAWDEARATEVWRQVSELRGAYEMRWE